MTTSTGTDAATSSGRMRFAVDGWDPTYGRSLEMEDDLGESTAQVQTDVETPAERWAPVEGGLGVPTPEAVLFVDGVRRMEARIWIEEVTGAAPGTDASPAVAASYAAGAVCCCGTGAHLLTALPRRGLFTVAPHAVDVVTNAGTYTAIRTVQDPNRSLAMTLSGALQRRLAELEAIAATAARAELPGHGVGMGSDLLVLDGPLRRRTQLQRAVGFVKSHRAAYLPADLHRMVGTLTPGQRTPVFLMGTSWDRYAWYLRLPCLPGAPWAGVVRLECSPDIPAGHAVGLANLTQTVLPRFASTEYKDARAPQNLYPIAGLERDLRRRLGDPRLLYRALRQAAAS